MAQGLSIIPFKDISHRSIWLRVTLLNATFFGMIACAPLWTNEHTFPMLRIVPGFPILHAPWDQILFGAMLLSLVAAAWFYRQAVGFFLVASLFVYCEDENRGQPWLYMYWVMLVLTLFSEKTAIAACRCGMSAVYIWSGIQKCNREFFNVQPGWFAEPLGHWHFPKFLVDLTQCAVSCAPFVEMFIGTALWLPRLRRLALGAAIAVHAYSLLVLGPLGHNYNWVVWPWNIAMPTLLWVLFAKGAYWEKSVRAVQTMAAAKSSDKGAKGKPAGKVDPERTVLPDASLKQTFADLRRSKPALTIIALYSLLPILSYFGMWDSYFSFCLYSENLARADFFITEEYADRLPPRLKSEVKPFRTDFDPQHQGPLKFVYGGWCYKELHVPPISESRNFTSVYKAMLAWSQKPGDVRMIVGERTGRVVFYQGDEREYLIRQ